MIHSYSGDPTPLSENALNIENAETIKGKIKINQTKCNIINCNCSSTNTPPQKWILNNNKIVPVDRIKLVGVTLTINLLWKETLLI